MFLRTLSLLFFIIISGCSSFGETLPPEERWEVEKLYHEAKKELKNKNYQTAIEYFEKVETRFPFTPYAKQALLDTAYANYMYEEPEAALSSANRFIKMNPRHKNVDYAYYLRGLATFIKPQTPIDKFFKLNPAERDTKQMKESFQYFSELIQRYPKSKYIADSKQRMVHLQNNIAEHELYIANYYLDRGAYVAAVNRAKFIIENYQNSTSTKKAMEIMSSAYRSLSMEDLANDVQRTLELNSQ